MDKSRNAEPPEAPTIYSGPVAIYTLARDGDERIATHLGEA